jgi:hypothetical protein
MCARIYARVVIHHMYQLQFCGPLTDQGNHAGTTHSYMCAYVCVCMFVCFYVWVCVGVCMCVCVCMC